MIQPTEQRHRRFLRRVRTWLPGLGAAFVCSAEPLGAAASTPGPAAPAAATEAGSAQTLYIREYRVIGATKLDAKTVGDTVYPLLGPGRTEADIELARAALEKAYHERGYQTVTVEVPAQEGRGGIILLQVRETPVGRLRVRGARYFSPRDITREAPSMAEGIVPNFNDITRDIVRLNRFADRRITPELKPGVVPGTVDIDLNVKDTFPLHGSVELNNRYSADTTELRLNASLSYANLWQLGHTVGASFQISPQNPDEVRVFSAYYLTPVPGVEWLSLMLLGTKQDSNVSTLGGSAVTGRGETVGARALFQLPGRPGFYQSATAGVDYRTDDQRVVFGGQEFFTPTRYYPVSLGYGAVWSGNRGETEFNASATFAFRGLGGDPVEFDNSRYKADGGFLRIRADVARTQELPAGFEGYAKLQTQLTRQPLVSTEQASGGGLGTVRGYLEGEVVGDNAVFGSLELRTPSLLGWLGPKDLHEWRLYAFVEGGILTLNEPLPEQEDRFDLASFGAGTRLRLFRYLNGSLDAGIPLIDQTQSRRGDLLLTFRLWGEF